MDIATAELKARPRFTDLSVEMNEQIRKVIQEHGQLSVDVGTLGDGDDLYQAGMSSHASVNLMIALEDSFDVEFLDSMLTRGVFESIGSIEAALQEVRRVAA